MLGGHRHLVRLGAARRRKGCSPRRCGVRGHEATSGCRKPTQPRTEPEAWRVALRRYPECASEGGNWSRMILVRYDTKPQPPNTHHVATEAALARVRGEPLVTGTNGRVPVTLAVLTWHSRYSATPVGAAPGRLYRPPPLVRFRARLILAVRLRSARPSAFGPTAPGVTVSPTYPDNGSPN